jgi:hypothetical protein
LGGSVDREPALLGPLELLLIGFHPPHGINPTPKGAPCFLGEPTDVHVRARILLVLKVLPRQPAALHHDDLGVWHRVIVAGIHEVAPLGELEPTLRGPQR